MHRLRVSTGKKIFFLFLAALAGCPPWPSPDQADSLSWTGLQWRNDMVMKGQWAASHERAMELLLDLGVEGFESLAGSGTIFLDLSVLNPEAALCQVHDVPLNATVESMQTYAAMMLLVSPDQISIQNANHTHINPLMPLSSLLVNGQVELLVIPRDRVGGDCGESSAVPIETMDFEMNAPVYPRDPNRRRVEEQPDPKDRPSKRLDQRWLCKALVEHLGTGKAVTGTWHPKFQEFTGPTSDDVASQREAWISDYLHPKPRGAKTGAKFAPTVQSEGRTKRLATPNSMEEVRRAGPTSEQARPGPGRGHVFEPSAPSRLEEPVIIEKMKTNANWFEQAAARQVARATHLIGTCTLLCFHSMCSMHRTSFLTLSSIAVAELADQAYQPARKRAFARTVYHRTTGVYHRGAPCEDNRVDGRVASGKRRDHVESSPDGRYLEADGACKDARAASGVERYSWRGLLRAAAARPNLQTPTKAVRSDAHGDARRCM